MVEQRVVAAEEVTNPSKQFLCLFLFLCFRIPLPGLFSEQNIPVEED